MTHITTNEHPNSSDMDISDGRQNATTLGQFIAMLVDNKDTAVIWSVVCDTQPDNDGLFIRTVMLDIIPNGHVVKAIENMTTDDPKNISTIHKHLVEAIKANIIY